VPEDGRSFATDGEFIDARGKHITPGLIDCHSHTGLFSGGVNEGGQVVTSEVRMGDITNPDTISWYRQLAGGITAVNQLHGSANPIGGQSQTVKNRWGVVRPEDMHMEGARPGIKFALGENVKRSNGTREQTRYPSTRMGVETLILDRFTAAREYAALRAGSQTASAQQGHEYTSVPPGARRDLELEALAEILAGERLVHCHSYRQDEILMLCRVAGDFGFTIGTFQHILEGYKVATAIRENAIGASSFSDWWAYKVEVQDAIPFNGAIMHDVGVNVSFNSDSDELARRMNAEAGKGIKYGDVPPEEALKFVTLNPAIQLGIAERVGSLEKDKDADFVIWNGGPLSSMTRAEATWIDGREYFSLEQDDAHRERIGAERARIIQKILGAKKGGKEEADDEPPFEPEPEEKPVLETPPEHWIVRQRREALREHYLDLLNQGHTLESAVCGDCGCTLEAAR
jgi:N-acetylglucosamine-6-phosphate deacetylase